MKPVKRTKAEKRFTDRVAPRSAFEKILEDACGNMDEFFVLTYYGIGGIGKSALLGTLAHSLRDDGRNIPYVMYDFDEETGSRSVILRLKNMLRTRGFEFPLLETAEYLHAVKSGTDVAQQKSGEEDSGIFSNPYVELLVSAADMVLPGVGIATQIISLVSEIRADRAEAGKFFERFLRRSFDGDEDALKRRLDSMKEMEAGELLAAFPEYFCEDLCACMAERDVPLVIFLDTYEKLVNTYDSTGYAAAADRWLRDRIIANIPGILWVIAGRERIAWADTDPVWEGIDQHLLGDLSESDAREYLSAAGVDPSLFGGIYRMTGGTPVFLDICVDIYWQRNDSGQSVSPEMFRGSSERLVERYLRYMDRDEKNVAKLLSALGNWSDEEALYVAQRVIPRFEKDIYEEFIGHTIIRKDDDGMRYFMHASVRRVMRRQLEEDFLRNVCASRLEYFMSVMPLRSSVWFISRCDEFASSLAGSGADDCTVREAFDLAEAQLRTLRREGDYETQKRAASIMWERLKNSPPSLAGVRAESALALATLLCGDFRAALGYAEETLVINDIPNADETDIARARCMYAYALMMNGSYDEAETILKVSCAVLDDTLGEDDPVAMYYAFRLGLVYSYLGRDADQLRVHSLVYERRLRNLGAFNTETINAARYVAVGKDRTGHRDEALAVLRNTYDTALEHLGRTHPITVETLQEISVLLRETDPQGALDLAEEIVAIRTERYGEDHVRTLSGTENLGDCLAALGRKEEALEIYGKTLSGWTASLGEKHPNTLRVREKIGKLTV